MIIEVIKKEGKQLLTDKGLLLIALLQPIIFIVVFGSTFQGGGDIKHISTIVVDYDNTNYSNYVIEAIQSTDFFSLKSIEHENLEDALRKVNNSEVRAVLFIPEGFGKNISEERTGDLEFYLDSSDFMVYKTLSAVEGLVIKKSLTNITNILLGDIETEKEVGKEKIEHVKNIFEEIRNESKILEKDINDSKTSSNGININEINGKIKNLKDGLDNQTNFLNQTSQALSQLTLGVGSLETQNVEQQQTIVAGMTQITDNFNESLKGVSTMRGNLNSINLNSNDTGLDKKIEDRLNHMKNLFDEADKLSQGINFDLKKLQKDFLSEPLRLKENQSYGEIKYFDYLGGGILSLIVFFLGLMLSSVNIINEKEKNTLYRISTTPAKGGSIFLGKFILFIIFGFVELVYTILLAVFLYHLRIDGSIMNVVFILFLLNCSAISLGLLISSKIKTMQQGLIIIPLLIIPSFLLSQTFFPKDMLPNFMVYISYISPMTFSTHALREVMIKGLPLLSNSIIPDLIALGLFVIIPLVLFVWSYRRIKY